MNSFFDVPIDYELKSDVEIGIWIKYYELFTVEGIFGITACK